jgi:hypothetical protein
MAALRDDSMKDIDTKDAVDPQVTDVDAEDAYNLYDSHEIDQAYLNASKGTRFFRGVLFQMIIFAW